MNDLFPLELEQAKQREVERQLRLLGDLIQQDYSYNLLHERAHRVLVPIQVLRTWWLRWQKQGKEGLHRH
jgi:hypothetical protein